MARQARSRDAAPVDGSDGWVRSRPTIIMATIVIVEDVALDRKLLAAMLASGGHRVIEASDGEEALALVERERPDVIVSDILMPTVDGPELVRRLRQRPALAAIPVVFHTAAYHEHETRAVAKRAGVVAVITKPATREAILRAVDEALGRPAAEPGERARAPDDTAARQRMAAVLAAALEIAGERDPETLLRKVASEAREVTLAQHAFTGLLSDTGTSTRQFFASGLDAQAVAALEAPSVKGSVIGDVVRRRRPVRHRNPQGQPGAFGLPAGHPPVSSLLSVPIASPRRTYGWLSLRNKLGSDEFTAVDEDAALALAAHAAIAYENARLLSDADRRGDERAQSARDDERARLSRSLHDELVQTLVAAGVDLDGIAERLTAGAEPPAELAGAVRAAAQLLAEAVAAARRIAGGLRIGLLELGLPTAVEAEAEAFERRWGIRCHLVVRGELHHLDAGRAVRVFRIVQQALTNVGQHARATRATVTVCASAARLTVSIADNGRGIAPAALDSPDSLGLIGMRERATLLDGHLEVRPRRARGTIVRLTIPFRAGQYRPPSA